MYCEGVEIGISVDRMKGMVLGNKKSVLILCWVCGTHCNPSTKEVEVEGLLYIARPCFKNKAKILVLILRFLCAQLFYHLQPNFLLDGSFSTDKTWRFLHGRGNVWV